MKKLLDQIVYNSSFYAKLDIKKKEGVADYAGQ